MIILMCLHSGELDIYTPLEMDITVKHILFGDGLV